MLCGIQPPNACLWVHGKQFSCSGSIWYPPIPQHVCIYIYIYMLWDIKTFVLKFQAMATLVCYWIGLQGKTFVWGLLEAWHSCMRNPSSEWFIETSRQQMYSLIENLLQRSLILAKPDFFPENRTQACTSPSGTLWPTRSTYLQIRSFIIYKILFFC